MPLSVCQYSVLKRVPESVFLLLLFCLGFFTCLFVYLGGFVCFCLFVCFSSLAFRYTNEIFRALHKHTIFVVFLLDVAVTRIATDRHASCWNPGDGIEAIPLTK